LYNIEQRNYRNDYAFAIADIILNGHKYNPQGIPGPMLNVDQPIRSITAKDNTFIIRDESKAYVVPRMNLHVMSKAYLLSEQFKEFVELESA
jgi:hypothetical protein